MRLSSTITIRRAAWIGAILLAGIAAACFLMVDAFRYYAFPVGEIELQTEASVRLERVLLGEIDKPPERSFPGPFCVNAEYGYYTLRIGCFVRGRRMRYDVRLFKNNRDNCRFRLDEDGLLHYRCNSFTVTPDDGVFSLKSMELK
jgi:hypothetical protein